MPAVAGGEWYTCGYMWIFYAAGSAVAAALVAIFGKIGLQGIDPTQATIVRGVVMALVLVLGGLTFGKLHDFNFTIFAGRAGLFILLSALAGAASWIFYFSALQSGPASAVAVIDKMSVVLVIVLAAIFLGESFTARSVWGVFFTMIGALLIVFK